MKTYWITWAVLLVFTVVMLWADTATMPRLVFVLFMLAAMLVKASIIAGNAASNRAFHAAANSHDHRTEMGFDGLRPACHTVKLIPPIRPHHSVHPS